VTKYCDAASPDSMEGVRNSAYCPPRTSHGSVICLTSTTSPGSIGFAPPSTFAPSCGLVGELSTTNDEIVVSPSVRCSATAPTTIAELSAAITSKLS
jgi:hypothetical protein